jgi:hypothetical protein
MLSPSIVSRHLTVPARSALDREIVKTVGATRIIGATVTSPITAAMMPIEAPGVMPISEVTSDRQAPT